MKAFMKPQMKALMKAQMQALMKAEKQKMKVEIKFGSSDRTETKKSGQVSRVRLGGGRPDARARVARTPGKCRPVAGQVSPRRWASVAQTRGR